MKLCDTLCTFVRYLPAGKQGYFTEIHKVDTEMHKENLKIIIINGPNLNLLGKREPDIYGETTFNDYLARLRLDFPEFDIDYFQSNVEGELINKIQETGFDYDGIILNAGGYTHTSVAISDAINSITTPVIEVHISNILSREEFRHKSLIGPYCKGSVMGFGLKSYHLALASFS